MPRLDVLGGQVNTRALGILALGPALCWKEKGRNQVISGWRVGFADQESWNLEAGRAWSSSHPRCFLVFSHSRILQCLVYRLLLDSFLDID